MKTVIKLVLIVGAIALALLVAAPLGINAFILGPKVQVPKAEAVEVSWETPTWSQNWTKEEWDWWYHVPQGSAFETVIPYDWFINLEQPKLAPFLQEVPLLTKPEYMAGFGFLPDPKGKYNPDGLPVGFAKSDNFWNPVATPENGLRERTDVIGFTCAACHTGQINFKGKGLRVEGGPAITDVNKFKAAAGFSLLLTKIDPLRFNRFATRVLGAEATPDGKAALKGELDALVKDAIAQAKKTKPFYPPEGFARLDALDRIDNFVFGAQVAFENYRKADAPVSYPHIWSSPWFDWVQYNGSVMQPMTRNAGEAMGVFARVQLDADKPDLYQSNVDVKNLYEIEHLLAKDSIFTGLSAPKWPEGMLGAIDSEKAAKGKVLYEKNCQQCHLPPMNSDEFMDDKYWTTVAKMDPKYLPSLETISPKYFQQLTEENPKYLKVTMKNLYDIGTDPTTTKNWYESTINMKTLMNKAPGDRDSDYFDDHGIVRAGQALPFAVTNTANKRYEDLGIPKEEWPKYDGLRPNLARTPLAYKARPLNGVWATPPFLHNGSVPNLYEVLIPAAQRTKVFYSASKEFDPKVIGYDTGKVDGVDPVDTSKLGSFNTGHSFEGDGTGQGVIGPELTDDERWALVEYLKTL
ncbi:MAG: cytochrome c [Merismopedia sp. SIO2A8]|nr:cytochrome c [Merismopedia sp. SIO2A8]